jgi:hypothetical protein
MPGKNKKKAVKKTATRGGKIISPKGNVQHNGAYQKIKKHITHLNNEPKFGILIERIEYLENKKFKKKVALRTDFKELQDVFYTWKKSKKEYEMIKKIYFSIKRPHILCEVDSFRRELSIFSNKKFNASSCPIFLDFVAKVKTFEEKHNLTCVLYEVAVEIEFSVRDLFFDYLRCLPAPIQIDDGISVYRPGSIPELEIDFDFLKFVDKVKIKETSKTDITLKSLSRGLNKYFPTIITYESKNAEKTFLLSIPQNCHLKEINKICSKDITAIHKNFFSTKRGRPKSSGYFQSIFNKEIVKLKKPGVDPNKFCKKMVDIFKAHGNEITWKTIYKNHYLPWYKQQKGMIKR